MTYSGSTISSSATSIEQVRSTPGHLAIPRSLTSSLVVSASSDALILAWNPHSTSHEDQVAPKRIGRHGDYARCLASANEAGWVVSGSFDKQIKIWDIVEGRSNAVGASHFLLRLCDPSLTLVDCSRFVESACIYIFSLSYTIWIAGRCWNP